MAFPGRFWLLLPGLVLLVLVGWLILASPRGHRVEQPAIHLAVLPFESPSNQQEDIHLAHGLNLDLHTRLRRLSTLQCSPRGLATVSRARDLTTSEWARRLGAEVVVTGSVRLQSGRIQLLLEVHDARALRQLGRFELEDSRESIFDLQRRAARSVVEVLPVQPTSREIAALRQDPTRSLKAWEYAMQGLIYLEDVTHPRGPVFAADLYRRAIQLDPEFLQARLGLGQSLWLGHLRFGAPATLVEAEHEARRVLRADPTLISAVVSLVEIQTDRQESTSELFSSPQIRALGKPDEALRDIAVGLLEVGRLELSEAAWRAAVEASGDYWVNPFALGQFFVRGGRYAEAEAAFVQAANLAPAALPFPRESLTMVRLATGDLSGAVETFETLQQSSHDFGMIRQIAAAYSTLGQVETAEVWLKRALELAPTDPRLLEEMGDIQTRLGRADSAQSFYSRGVESASRSLEQTPGDVGLQARLSVLSAKGQNCSRALSLAATLRRHQTDRADIYQELALAYALCHEPASALEILRTALALGVSPESIRAQPELRQAIAGSELESILESTESGPPSP